MKVLVADDEVVSRRMLESLTRHWGYEPIVASDGLEASRILHQPDAPKLALLDWMMPGLDGVELCRALRTEKKDDAYVYILLLTAKHAKEDVIEGLEAGADDYIVKPFDSRELQVRIRSGKRVLYLLEQLTTARETLRELAARDPLTSLWNRTSIIELLDAEVQRARRQGSSLGVVLVDFDHFKEINDKHGHLTGDRVLGQAAESMQSAVRPYDAVGRYGGEEFLIVLPGCDRINAESHAERLRQALRELAISAPQGTIHFTASFGVTVIGPEMVVDAIGAIGAADLAMYAAKRGGRDRVEFLAPIDVAPAVG